MSSTSSHRLRRGVGVTGMAVAMLALMLPAGAAAAGRVGPTAAELAGLEPVTSGPRRCVVRHDGVSYTTLQEGVDAAEPGETVTLQGTCVGFTLVDKDVTIRGVRTAGSGEPTISGQGRVSVLWVGGDIDTSALRPAGPSPEPGYGTVLTTVGLRITRGFSSSEGAIALANGAGLILRNSILERNRGTEAGVIRGYSGNLLILRGTTEIRRNSALEGQGGAVNFGVDSRIELHDSSSMHHNRAWEDGGAIRTSGGSVVVLNDDSAIRDNSTISDDDGGGLYLDTSADTPRIELTLNDRARIHGNRATNHGGGVFGYELDIVLNDSARIEENGGDDGAGVRMGESTLTLNDSSMVNGNVSSDDGGAVYAYDASVITLNDTSRIRGNRSLTGKGGGIRAYDSTITIADSARVTGNRTTGDGGGINATDSSVYVQGNARITGNRAPLGSGGGIYAYSSTLVLEGTSIVEQNRAADLGGGIHLGGSDSSLDFNGSALVRQNIAGDDAGGVYAAACITVTDLVAGTNVLSNTPNDFVQPVC